MERQFFLSDGILLTTAEAQEGSSCSELISLGRVKSRQLRPIAYQASFRESWYERGRIGQRPPLAYYLMLYPSNYHRLAWITRQY
jgi:hypothetical protein